MRSFIGRDVLSLRDWERHELLQVLDAADELAPLAKRRETIDLLTGRILVSAFYSPSTRTRLATESAMLRMGGQVVGFADARSTRAGDFFQESVMDTARMLESYGDVVAMRHFDAGAPAEAARWCSIPVVNCGDGWGEHPTQALTDLYTIRAELGSLDGLNVLCVGDVRMRTMRSLALASSQFDIQLVLVVPEHHDVTPEFRAELTAAGTNYVEAPSVDAAIGDADVIYMEATSQPDHATAHEGPGEHRPVTPPALCLGHEILETHAQRHAIVLHSLPRMDELPTAIDRTRHQRYWAQSANGVLVRMALLGLILGAVQS